MSTNLPPSSFQADKWFAPQNNLSLETITVHGGVNPDRVTGAILTPICLNTTFVQDSVEDYLSKGYSYSRQNNPTVASLEERIALLEDGYGAVCVSSGMAAIVTVFSAFLKTGDHCIVTNCSYIGTNKAARFHFSKYNIDFSFVDLADLEAVRSSINPKTRMVFSETATNPILHLADIKAISDIIAACPFPIVHVCDSTFTTPFIVKPLTLGADLVIQSTTKYFDGHNVTFGGAVSCKTKELHDALLMQRNILGNIMSPNVAFFTAQTMKTLHLRIARQSATAQKIAEFLDSHPNVMEVRYPGLKSFPQKELADRQYADGLYGGMIKFEVKGGIDAGCRLINNIKRPWSLCENLGACESIISCPCVYTHADMSNEDRLKIGITDGLIRISCGLEDPSDLISPLKASLDSL